MKSITVMMIVGLAGCGPSAAEAIRDFIPGVYVEFSQSEYSMAWDTLRISAYDPQQGVYTVRQHTGYQRIVEGKLQPKQEKASTALTSFDPGSHQLQDLGNGKRYTFFPDRGTVLAGGAEYAKIR